MNNKNWTTMDKLLNLEEFKQKLTDQIGNANLSDCLLPETFKSTFKGFGDYKIEKYYEYTIKVSSRKSICYIPNQWIYIAAICSEYCIELKKYKQKLKDLGITDDDFEACHPSTSDKTVPEEKRSIEYVSKKAEELLSSYTGEDKDLLVSFLWDYESWGGGKNIKRDNDFTISPCLNVANSINSSSSLIGDIAKAIADNITLFNSIMESDEMKSVLKEQTQSIKKELFRQKAAATFLKKAMRITQERDPNFDFLAALNLYKKTSKQLQINGFNIGRDKNQLPTRLDDVDTSISWQYDSQEYVLYLEFTPEMMEELFLPVYNKAYQGVFFMQKDSNDEYVLYELGVIKHKSNRDNEGALQKIFYGAPGTGKSNTIKRKVDEKGKKNYRVTFHPDSDYSTFVGTFKPTMTKVPKTTLIGTKVVEVENGAPEEKIVYRFVPQAFTKAYIAAWNTEEDVYLIIEEINRGNCAQIFGDLFQLLDRGDDGFSEYPVEADTDLGSYIAKELADSSRQDFPNGVKEGKKLVLPKNLYIWATMNTSDQSLFPIDSAFKRRWDWVYVPIDTKKENWSIKVGEKRYSWTDFLEKINNDILTDETAEDKHLGFYFCKAENNEISQETFVGKVLFYLWNDVFKVYGIPAIIGSSKDWAYTKFYNPDGNVNEQKVIDLMKKLQITPEGSNEDTEEKIDEQ